MPLYLWHNAYIIYYFIYSENHLSPVTHSFLQNESTRMDVSKNICPHLLHPACCNTSADASIFFCRKGLIFIRHLARSNIRKNSREDSSIVQIFPAVSSVLVFDLLHKLNPLRILSFSFNHLVDTLLRNPPHPSEANALQLSGFQ